MHLHSGGMQFVLTFLAIVAVFGALHLAAISAPGNPWAKAWLSLNF